jgi:DNA primase
MACPYSLRVTPMATVSTPLSWDELDEIDPSRLRIDSVPERADPWKSFWKPK